MKLTIYSLQKWCFQGKWFWDGVGTAVADHLWETNQPDNHGYYENGQGENCAIMRFIRYHANGMWIWQLNDVPCKGSKHPFICEIK